MPTKLTEYVQTSEAAEILGVAQNIIATEIFDELLTKASEKRARATASVTRR